MLPNIICNLINPIVSPIKVKKLHRQYKSLTTYGPNICWWTRITKLKRLVILNLTFVVFIFNLPFTSLSLFLKLPNIIFVLGPEWWYWIRSLTRYVFSSLDHEVLWSHQIKCEEILHINKGPQWFWVVECFPRFNPSHVRPNPNLGLCLTYYSLTAHMAFLILILPFMKECDLSIYPCKKKKKWFECLFF